MLTFLLLSFFANSPSLSLSIYIYIYIYIYICIYTPIVSFSSKHSLIRFHLSPQISRSLFRVLINFCSAAVRMVSITWFWRLFSRFLCTVPRASTTIGITANLMFPGFINSLARSRYLSSFSPSLTSKYWSPFKIAVDYNCVVFSCPFFVASLRYIVALDIVCVHYYYSFLGSFYIIHKRLSDSKFHQVSRTFMSFMAYLIALFFHFLFIRT